MDEKSFILRLFKGRKKQCGITAPFGGELGI